MSNKRIIVSAIQFNKGGPLTILQECLAYLCDNLSGYSVLALVQEGVELETENVELIRFKKRNWLNRLWHEYISFQKIAKEQKPVLWLSLHDLTPFVWPWSDRTAVYCHNASPFYKLSAKDVKFAPKLIIFRLLYGFVYRFNINRNRYVIVQQRWLREEFAERYGVDREKIIVAQPAAHIESEPKKPEDKLLNKNGDGKEVFFYPSFPRVFKNFEIICEAARILNARGITGFKVELTIDKTLGKYAEFIYNSYSDIDQIEFLGLLSRTGVFERYQKADVLIFPSQLETWGLPISEFKSTGKPMFVADLPYAHETVGDYQNVSYFEPDAANELANLMASYITGSYNPSPVEEKPIEPPFTQSWEEMFRILLSDE